ncbi:transposase ISSpo9 [Leisingera methylohalidivorans DSM 14336]|uniref:Transposase ISSpo9 n=1 Tax=Leisingera methylohalidivorans DSM 14336 TaxID=999552 RepID=V9VWE1_9RHOB|nr:transposase ISSpo9 [Leisingera methylohalidivorans DSM 14336]
MKLLGQSLMARGFNCQVAEIQVRIAVLNRDAALGIPVAEPAGGNRPGNGEVWTHPDLCNKT